MTDRPARILIVDDEPQNRRLLEVMLAPENFSLLTAASGEEALALVAQRSPDLILLDVMMPGMDGYQVAASIKSNVTTKNIPVIVVTALDDRNARMLGLSAGAEDFLTKPVDRAELVARVRNLLRLKAAGEELDRRTVELQRKNAELERLSLLAEQARVRAEEAQIVAERSLVVQERFMALTTHEIRTPLNAMLGYLELVETQLAELLTEKQVGYFLKARSACNHLIGVTNDFLDMAKGEAGHLRVARHAGAARQVMSDAAALVAPQAAAQAVEITLTETTEHVMYLGDSDRVRQVLVNILGNAVSFTPHGGSIRVTAALVDEPPAGSALVGGPWCTIRVEDSGPGIPSDTLDRVFEPFVQVGSASQSGRRGTGLGLTVSRQLALVMGGDLTVEGSAGIDGGAAFTLWLAAAPTAASAPAKETANVRGSEALQTG